MEDIHSIQAAIEAVKRSLTDATPSKSDTIAGVPVSINRDTDPGALARSVFSRQEDDS